MTKNNKQISATEFKKHFLQLVDEVNKNNDHYTITKRKIPIAQVIPLPGDTISDTDNYYGCMQGTALIKEDIVNVSFESEWEVTK